MFDKKSKGEYLEKYDKNGNLLTTAEQYTGGNWIVSEYPLSKTNMQGEYSDEEFKTIRKHLFLKK